MSYVAETERVGNLIVQVVADESGAGDPLDADNLGIMLCWHPDYTLGNEQFQNVYGRGAIDRHKSSAGTFESMDEVVEYIRTKRGGINLIPLFLYDHSGISISAGATIPDEAAPDPDDINVDRSGGFASRTITGGYSWDTSMVGFIFTNKEQMDLLGTTDEVIEVDDIKSPLLRGKVPGTVRSIDHYLRSEVNAYNDFLTGYVWGYTVTKPCPDAGHDHDTPEQLANCAHSEVVDSCWGYLGDPAEVMKEGTSTATWINEHPHVEA